MANDIVSQFQDIMDDFLSDVVEVVGETADEVADETLDVLKSAGGFEDHRGKYRRSPRKKKTGSTLAPKVTLYASGQEYRLTHLLEYGHATKDGTVRTTGSTEAFPHWEDADAYIKEQYESRVGKKIEGLG